MSKTKALVILSGGQDSTTCLAWALKAGYDVCAVTFNYNQRHSIELQAARAVATLAGVTDHEVVSLGPILQGTSPLTNPSESLETYKDFASMEGIIGDRVEKTFVPMRNSLFLTIAANRAVVKGASILITGVCEADNANYPDCRGSFIKAQQWAINEALGFNDDKLGKDYLHIQTPLLACTKAQSIAMMMNLGCLEWLAFTHTAYDGTYPPVSKDHANVLRAQGFEDIGVPDPLVLRANMEGLMALPFADNYKDDALNTRIKDRIRKLAETLNAATGKTNECK
jgi:7-cyano-7-deazaguanine synthase